MISYVDTDLEQLEVLHIEGSVDSFGHFGNPYLRKLSIGPACDPKFSPGYKPKRSEYACVSASFRTFAND